MKRRKGIIKLIVSIIIIILIALVVIILDFSNVTNASKLLNKNNNIITFNNENARRYINIKVTDNNEIEYKIISPKGDEIKSDELDLDDGYSSKGYKGEWKIVFNIEDELTIDYRIWVGNLEKNKYRL